MRPVRADLIECIRIGKFMGVAQLRPVALLQCAVHASRIHFGYRIGLVMCAVVVWMDRWWIVRFDGGFVVFGCLEFWVV